MVSEYTFREKECHDLLGETIVIIFAELTRFSKLAPVKSVSFQKANALNTNRICTTRNALEVK